MACCKPCCGCAVCSQGQEGKCCCGGATGTCCQPGEYCCSGVCQATPCDGCEPCDCVVPDPRTDTWTEAIDSCVVDSGGSPACDLGAGEFSGVGGDMGVQWATGYLASVDGCTVLLQVAYGSPNDSGVYWRVWKCNSAAWVNVTSQAFVADATYPATLLGNGWWCKQGDCDETPPFDAPACDAPP